MWPVPKVTRETRDLRAAGRDVCRSQGGAIPSEVTGSGTSEETTEWWRSSTLPPGAVLPDFHGPNTSASASIASSVSVKDESFAVIGSPQTAVPLESLNTVPFEALLGISFIVLRLTDNEIRAYRVGTVSRNFSTSSTAIEFVTRETLLMQSDGLAVLLAPSNTILAGWNIEPGATPGAASGFHNQTNAVQAGIASESSSTETSVLSAVHPLTNAEVTEWLVRTKADHETDLSASVGQPLQPAPPVSGNAGSAEIPTSVFPLTDEEYKELDRGEPLLEGFPVVSLSADSPGTTAQDEQLAGSASETRQKTKFLENSAADTNPLAMETGALLPEAQDGLGDAATLR
ncbi:hypothetical protein BESB_008440 [Besnoitia besnoiti]|uniref:Uncharacterized protein n=1 Tax=Besnoitia besnoiti TaxID=94643 RepID=A0A2A9MQV3_BESBE|nr:hypothetical protein BESB_008440 [Besnoitia besnoiti]PFH38502.1 hypothetical protein BESB_008440 [Besnoitia besnoiti]